MAILLPVFVPKTGTHNKAGLGKRLETAVKTNRSGPTHSHNKETTSGSVCASEQHHCVAVGNSERPARGAKPFLSEGTQQK